MSWKRRRQNLCQVQTVQVWTYNEMTRLKLAPLLNSQFKGRTCYGTKHAVVTQRRTKYTIHMLEVIVLTYIRLHHWVLIMDLHKWWHRKFYFYFWSFFIRYLFHFTRLRVCTYGICLLHMSGIVESETVRPDYELCLVLVVTNRQLAQIVSIFLSLMFGIHKGRGLFISTPPT